jgi:hypothetical protein
MRVLPDDRGIQVVSPELREVSIGKPKRDGNEESNDIGPSDKLISLSDSKELVAEKCQARKLYGVNDCRTLILPMQ